MKVFVIVACVFAVAAAQDNLVQLATKLGATELVQLLTDARLADIIATGGKHLLRFVYKFKTISLFYIFAVHTNYMVFSYIHL